MSTSANGRPDRICSRLVMCHIGTLLAALVVALAVAHYSKQQATQRGHSTFERQTPHLSNWPRYVRPLPRA